MAEINSMKLKDGSEIKFIPKPEMKENFWIAIKIIKDGQTCGIALDEESYNAFLYNLLKIGYE
jgi:hypothetical protein